MPEAASVNETNATAASPNTPLSVNRPERRGAANTNRFLDHCRGLMPRSNSRHKTARRAMSGPVGAIGISSATMRRVVCGRCRHVMRGRHCPQIGGLAPMGPTRGSRPDAAVTGAHGVVGLYGDPNTSWGIAAELGVREPDLRQANERLAALCAAHTHLGVPPVVEVVPKRGWTARRAELASRSYDTGALLRVAVSEDGRRLVVGAHHGAVDGLGLVAVAGVVLGEPLRSGASGIGDRASHNGF